MKLSVVIPARKEPLMQRTIDSFLEVSGIDGELEIIAVLDGPFMDPPVGDKRLKVVQLSEAVGMRGAINAGLAVATGKYIMKLDAHCAFGPNFDKIMIENCDDNFLMIPRRYSLDDAKWVINESRPARDYHYLHFPTKNTYGYAMTPQTWLKKNRLEIDETMSFQGSCWLANREYFMKNIGFLDDKEETYGTFAAEQLEIGLKYWLSGNKVLVNKMTWYAHLRKMSRHYDSDKYDKKTHGGFRKGWNWSTKHWMNDEEPGMVNSFAWLLEKFWPVPSWPEDRNQWVLDESD